MAVEVELGAYIYHASVLFSHNPLHDLESLWWVGVWFLLCHYRPKKLGETAVQNHIKVVKKFKETLFNNPVDVHGRRRALMDSALLANTRPLLFPRAVQGFIFMLNAFRLQLVAYYETYKPKESQDLTFFVPDMHRKFGDFFEDVMNKLRALNDQSKLWPLDDIEERITYLNTK